ncbi:unnamed protein product [Anisakis simplex]|uniref:Uncharacterized protein n=1 Tax=Anisakis simplex TaxID=6269 RepID=A0A0M3JR86_ANISI|nr:unnamed protein product [Anisakis simplex]
MIHPINIPADLLAPNSTSRPETFAVKRSRHSVSYTADGRRLVDGILATPSSPVNLWGELFVRSAVDRFNIEHKPRPNHKNSPITQNSIPKCQSVGDAFNEHGNVTVSNKSQSLDNISQVQPNIENGFCDDNLVYTELCSCSMPFTPCCSDRDLEIQIETDTQLDDMPDGIGKRLVITVNGDVV